jgi:RecJ-like exonuclease
MLDALKRAKDFFLARLSQDPAPSPSSSSQTKEALQNPTNEGYANIMETRFDASVFKKSVHVYSHLDSDGISAAAIIARTLARAKIGFQITILNQLENQYIEEMTTEVKKYNRFIIFADFGSGQTHILDKFLPPDDYLILDHHTPHEAMDAKKINHVNPYAYGIDGSYQISGAGVCYFFAKTMDPSNIDLAHIAIIGALGDTQNQGSDKGEFQFPNSLIVEDAIKANKLELVVDLAIPRTRPLVQAIAYNLPVPIPGLANNEQQTRQFLESNGIRTVNELNEPRIALDLTQIEKKSLSKALVQFALVNASLPPTFSNKLVTTFYTLKEYDPKALVSDAREISIILNACGRSGHPSLGIALLLGDKEALDEAIKESKSHRRNIALAMQWAEEHLIEHENIISVYGGELIDEKIIGTIASMLTHSGKKIIKPLIAYAEAEKGMFKVSARSPPELIERGLDLGAVMRKVCGDLGFENPGGGHRPAAGAKIPVSKLKEFLNAVDATVKEMLNAK